MKAKQWTVAMPFVVSLMSASLGRAECSVKCDEDPADIDTCKLSPSCGKLDYRCVSDGEEEARKCAVCRAREKCKGIIPFNGTITPTVAKALRVFKNDGFCVRAFQCSPPTQSQSSFPNTGESQKNTLLAKRDNNPINNIINNFERLCKQIVNK